MAKKGRRTPPRRGHLRSVPTVEENARSEPDSELVATVRRALRADGPLPLLDLVSTMVAATSAPGSAMDLDELIDSFVDVSFAETTAVVRVLAVLLPDEVRGARLRREIAHRRHPMPPWIDALDDAEVDGTYAMVDQLDDGTNQLVGVSIGRDRFTVVVYVDHNLGTVVKDAFTLPAPIDDVLDKMGEALEPSQTLSETDPATLRAVVESAIAEGDRFLPPLESESWPLSRAVVEWVVRKLPAGGSVAVPEETDADEITSDFLGSRYATGLPEEGESIVGDILSYMATTGKADPLLWSPVNVEMFLADWMPSKVLADAAYFEAVPVVLKAFVQYAHHARAIEPEDSLETLAAIPVWARALAGED